jgi:sporulation protein YlmC with PRC-barrel domain
MDRGYSFGGIVAVIAVAIVCASAAPRARPEARTSGPGLAPPILATDLIGQTVRTPDGEEIGEIEDLVLSPEDKVMSAVVSIGGLFGIGARQVDIPYDELAVAPNRGTLLVTMNGDRIAAKVALATRSDDSTPGTPQTYGVKLETQVQRP